MTLPTAESRLLHNSARPYEVIGWCGIITDMNRVIAHVLFDADGVLQQPPHDWHDVATHWVGERADDFLRTVFADEKPALTGSADLWPLLSARLAEFDVDATLDEIFSGIWLAIEQSPESIRLVEAVREAGFGVHIGTNQEFHRGSWMRSELGYDQLFDVGCWSYEMGCAKPDPEYFVLAAERIGAAPETIVFIDDREENVAAARTVGMSGIVWHLKQGHPVLAAELADHGVLVG